MPPPAIEWLGAGQFWSLYYSGRIVRLRRRAGTGGAGVYEHYAERQIIPEDRQFAYRHDVLAAHDYADWKFAAPITEDFSQCLITVLQSPVMARETAVHWQQLEFAAALSGEAPFQRDQDYGPWRRFLADCLRHTQVRLEEVEQEFLRRKPNQATAAEYDQLGDIRLLGLGRQLALKAAGFLITREVVLKLLAEVLENPLEDLDTQRIAIWALGRHNDKGAVGLLMKLLNSTAAANLSVPIGRALQFLCSGDEMIPMQYDNEVTYWTQIAARMPLTAEAWLERDAASVFWEKRLRAAMDPALSQVTRRALRTDEVPAVREAAIKPG